MTGKVPGATTGAREPVPDTTTGAPEGQAIAPSAPGGPVRMWRETWPNGNRKSECPMVRHPETGKLVKHGTWRSWNEDGSLNKEGAYVYGQQDGPWKFWFPGVANPVIEVYSMGRKLPSPPPAGR